MSWFAACMAGGRVLQQQRRLYHDIQDGRWKRGGGGERQTGVTAIRRHQRRLRDAGQLMGATKVREGDRRTCSSVQSHPQVESTTGHRSFILFI